MARALRRTAEAVLSSATTVVLGLLTLLLSLFPTTRGLGLACAVGVVVATFFALVVLPAALVCFGRWVFWPRVPRDGPGRAGRRPLRLAPRRRRGRGRRPGRTPRRTVALLAITALGATGDHHRPVRRRPVPRHARGDLRRPSGWPSPSRRARSDPTRIVTTADVDEVTRTAQDRRRASTSVRPGGSGGRGERGRRRARAPGGLGRGRRHRGRDSGRPSTDVAADLRRGPARPIAADEGRRHSRDRLGDHAADPAAGAGGAAAPAAGGGRARRCWSPPWSRTYVSALGISLVAVHPRVRVRPARRRGAADRLRVPGRARRRLQHLPGHPGPGGGARSRHQATPSGQENAASACGSRNSIPSDQVRWVTIGPRIPPVTRRWRPSTNPTTAAASTRSGMPAAAVTRA